MSIILSISDVHYNVYFRCPRYPSIPSYCVLVQDPKDPCCKTPSCSVKVPTPKPHVSPSPRPTQKPGPGQITPVPFTTLSPLVTPPTQPPRVPVVKGMYDIILLCNLKLL